MVYSLGWILLFFGFAYPYLMGDKADPDPTQKPPMWRRCFTTLAKAVNPPMVGTLVGE
jgi:hypothetical protein